MPSLSRIALACLLVLPAACTSDLQAPDNFITSASAGTGDPLMLACGDPIPVGAVDALYDFSPAIMGGDGNYSFVANGLPAGLAIDVATGNIGGTPTASAMVDVDITVTDGTGNTDMATCPLVINERLTVDLSTKTPRCLLAGERLIDFVTAGTGDGTEIVCDEPGGFGNGTQPAGLSIDPANCEIVGTISEPRFGTYAWIARASQSGAEVFVPFCASQSTQAQNAYRIQVTRESDPAVDATLQPWVETFNPDSSLAIGSMTDPRFEVRDQASCGMNSCFFGFAFGLNGSPFDGAFDLDPSALIFDMMMMNRPIGFFHHMQIAGAVPPDEFKTRPFVQSVTLDYCLADAQATCGDTDAIRQNGNGELHFSIIMFPQ